MAVPDGCDQPVALGLQHEKEKQVGITEFVNPHLARFSGVLKKR